ncbi:MAG: class B sortase [Clostridiales bacterium]|nr:class B sortase [Clostridiales bacterium]
MNKGLAIVLIVVCAIVFSVSAYKLLSYYGADRASEKEFAELLPEEVIESGEGLSDYDFMRPYYLGLREENPDMVGWLRIPGTRISYPVMQTPDNPEYYLDKNFKKEYTANGSLFASSISDVDEPTDVVIIFGHRMKTGAMFGSMGDFLDPDFLQEHETVIFDTFTCRNEYKVYCLFSLAIGVAGEFDYYNYSDFFTEEMFDTFVSQAQAISNVENPGNKPVLGDKILLLSTCEYTHENGRLVLVAVRVDD